MSIRERLKSVFQTRRAGVLFFSVAFAATTLALIAGGIGMPASSFAHSYHFVSGPDIQVSAELSQTKLIRGQNGEVLLNIGISTSGQPDSEGTRRPTDMVVVLDRSGSMSAANKMPYAKAAIRNLLGQLGAEDRFALISFDNVARVDVPLQAVTSSARGRIETMVNQLRPGASTNMSHGLEVAKNVLRAESSGRTQKVLLLSDGQANSGTTSISGLGNIARALNEQDAVVSTIGMGLGFNEDVMASVADHGMGNYSYLEDLSGLGEILAKDLADARALYAEKSQLEIEFPRSVQLVDASGYPIENQGNGFVRIRTGQILANVSKNIPLTLRIPTGELNEFAIGAVRFNYVRDGAQEQVEVSSSAMVVAVLSESEREVARESINEAVYKSSWAMNNLGRIRKDMTTFIRQGQKKEAAQTLDAYVAEVEQAEAQSGVSLMDDQLAEEVSKMQADLDEAFSGDVSEQTRKQNQLGKAYHYKSRSEQRTH